MTRRSSSHGPDQPDDRNPSGRHGAGNSGPLDHPERGAHENGLHRAPNPDALDVAVEPDLAALREQMGISQAVMSRLTGLSVRKISDLENGYRRPDPGTLAGITQLARLWSAIAALMDPRVLPDWFMRPNPAFQGLKPVEVIERGEIDRLWNMVFYLRTGVPS